MRYNLAIMIKSFKHKGLKNFFLYGDASGINPNHAKKLKTVLARINADDDIKDLEYPGYRLHSYKGKTDFWSIDVSGNYRILFEFRNGDAYILDYIYPH
jgi:proteic killer suppression protein